MAGLIDTLRAPKIPYVDMVIFDWAASALGAVFIAKKYNIGFLISFFIVILLSIFLHIIFDIPTKTNYYLSLSKDPRPKGA